jgi:hypothetical protein
MACFTHAQSVRRTQLVFGIYKPGDGEGGGGKVGMGKA